MLESLCAGKTTLCMAALWALTGSADVRADGKQKLYRRYLNGYLNRSMRYLNG
jgi:hypothetical protein